MPLEKFDQEVRLLDLGSTSNIKLSKNNKIDAFKIENSVDHLEFYIIQINSHFGKTQQDWRKVTDNIVINFITQRTSQDPTSITDKVLLSSLVTNQIQPVFYLSKTYPAGHPNNDTQTDFCNTVEIE
jgi:hypothetical protein